jgi:hypothetical protein
MAPQEGPNLIFLMFLCFILFPDVLLIILIYNNNLAQTQSLVAIPIRNFYVLIRTQLWKPQQDQNYS